MSHRDSQIESLLLAAGRPIKIADLARQLSCKTAEVHESIKRLEAKYNAKESGINLLVNNQQIQLATNPVHRSVVASFIKDETTGELTKPSLETLTIIAYRQPVTKEELEQIRGVNCSLILRNLMIRGLVEADEGRAGLATVYTVTMDFLRFLGIRSVEELPRYETLNSDENLQSLLASKAVEKNEKAMNAQ